MEDHSDQPEMGDHSDQPEMEDHSDQPEMGDHSDQPEMEDHSDQPEMEDHSDQPETADNSGQTGGGNNPFQAREVQLLDGWLISEEDDYQTKIGGQREYSRYTAPRRESKAVWMSSDPGAGGVQGPNTEEGPQEGRTQREKGGQRLRKNIQPPERYV